MPVSVDYDKHNKIALASGLFSARECDEILKACAKRETFAGSVINKEMGRRVQPDHRKCVTFSMDPDCAVFAEVHNRIRQTIRYVNKTYFGFRISYNKKYWWRNGGNIAYLGYLEPGDHFSAHTDWDTWVYSHRRLTALLQLSPADAYNGGDLEVIGAHPVWAPRTRGSMIIFPSLFYHRVTPILAGRRECIVSWWVGKEPLL